MQYKEYAHARGALIQRLGEYCSYCEMELDASLAVEHVLPKKPPGATEAIETRQVDWYNFLLACTNCNPTKGNREVVLNDYLWPHLDNTFRAITYTEGGVVSPATDLTLEIQQKAQSTIELVGLDKYPSDNEPAASDRRWRHRREAWDTADWSKDQLAKNNTSDFREIVTKLAKATGYWSVWMTVFADDPDMLERLIDAFPGTSKDCFDAHNGYTPQSRAGGQC